MMQKIQKKECYTYIHIRIPKVNYCLLISGVVFKHQTCSDGIEVWTMTDLF